MTININPDIKIVINQLSQYTDFFSPRISKNSFVFAFFSETRWPSEFENKGIAAIMLNVATTYPIIEPMFAKSAELPGSSFANELILKYNEFSLTTLLLIKISSIDFWSDVNPDETKRLALDKNPKDDEKTI